MREGMSDVHLWDYISQHASTLTFLTYQHASLAFQTVLVGTAIAIVVAVLVYRLPLASALTLTSSRVALTIPSLALLALLIVPFGLGVVPSFLMLAFFATMPVIGNAVVGLRSVPHSRRSRSRNRVVAVANTAHRRAADRVAGDPHRYPGLDPDDRRCRRDRRLRTRSRSGIAHLQRAFAPRRRERIGNGSHRNDSHRHRRLVFDALLVLLGRLTISRGLK